MKTPFAPVRSGDSVPQLPDDPSVEQFQLLEWYDTIPDVSMGSLIAFTWSPDPSKYMSYDPYKQYKALLKTILLKADKFFSLFAFVPECTASGNIHIHGMYILRDKIAYYKKFLPICKRYGYTNVKYHADRGWLYYMCKDIPDMHDMLEGLPVPLYDENIDSWKRMSQTFKGKNVLGKTSARIWTIPVTHYFK